MDVQLFIPCFMDQLYPDSAVYTVKVLQKLGCKVHYNTQQTCCGQPAFNAGFWDNAAPVCEKFVDDLNKNMPIVTPSGSCTGFVRNNYKEVIKGEKQVEKYQQVSDNLYELTEFIHKFFPDAELGASFRGKVAYHDACGALRECGIKSGPRALLAKVRGLVLVETEDCETCCGFGGTFSVKFEPISIAMAEQKVDSAIKAGAEYITSTDMSCLMHLEGYIKKFNLPIKVIHLADILASGWYVQHYK